MIKVLVTGSNGQLGNELRNLAPEFPFLDFVFSDIGELDITKKEEVDQFMQKGSFNYVINCAAYTAVDKAEEEQEKANLVNYKAVENLVAGANKYSTTLIHISTDYVFDGKNHRPYMEDDDTHPESTYGESKLKGELAAIQASKHIVIRTSWLYSSYGKNFMKTILKLSREREELNVIFDQVGTPTFAGDLARAIIEIINTTHNLPEFPSGKYHYSNEGVCSWYDFAKEIVDISHSPCRINPIESKDYPLPAPRPFYSVLNKNKIKTILNINIPHWKDSLEKCIKNIKY